MFDQPIVFVKSDSSNLDFFDEEMKDFSNLQVYNGAVDELLKLEPTPASVIICETETGEMTELSLQKPFAKLTSTEITLPMSS